MAWWSVDGVGRGDLTVGRGRGRSGVDAVAWVERYRRSGNYAGVHKGREVMIEVPTLCKPCRVRTAQQQIWKWSDSGTE